MCVPYFVRKMHKKFKKKAQNFVFQEVSDETGRWTIAEDTNKIDAYSHFYLFLFFFIRAFYLLR